MPRIKIEDLPRDMKISQEEMKKIMGGMWESFKGFLSEQNIPGMDGEPLADYPYEMKDWSSGIN